MGNEEETKQAEKWWELSVDGWAVLAALLAALLIWAGVLPSVPW